MSPNVWRPYIPYLFSFSICHSLFHLHFCMGNCTLLSKLPDHREVPHANCTSLQSFLVTRENVQFKTSSVSLLKGSCSSYAVFASVLRRKIMSHRMNHNKWPPISIGYCYKLFKTFLVKHHLLVLWNAIEVMKGALPGFCQFLTLILCILFLDFLLATYHSHFQDLIKHRV